MGEELDVGQLLAEQIERLFCAEDARSLRQSVEGRGELPTRAWGEVEALGVAAVMAGEASGGAGLSWTRAEPILRKLAERAVPLPLAETMLGAWALDACGMQQVPGPIAIATETCLLGADGRVTGIDPSVAWSQMARYLLVAARPDNALAPRSHSPLAARPDSPLRLCLINPADAQWTEQATHARIPSAGLRLNSVEPVQSAAVAPIVGERGLLPAMAVLRSVQIAGLLEHVLALCVEYANNRVQFGKPIGRFQAIQHLLAELAGQVAAAQVAGVFACRKLDAGEGELGAAVAKIRTAISATRGAAIAHQVFGAIGVTDEHELHYYTRRLWQWRAEAGSEHSWSEWLGHITLAAGAEALWPAITG